MREMKISDLSIGDWVQTEDCDARQNKCCVVEGIEKWRPDYVVVLKYEDGGIETLGRECISPIPLTPEILEKNGFEEGLKNGEAYKIKVGISQRLWLSNVGDGCWMFRLALGFFEDFDIAKVEIKYVHQLQHALRLAGVEKEIEV